MKKIIQSVLLMTCGVVSAQTVNVNFLGRYSDGREVACEISTYDLESKKLFVANAAADSIDIVDLSDIGNPQKTAQIDVLTYGGGVNSVVSLGGGHIAAAIEAAVKTDSGSVVIYDTAGNFVTSVTVGALPDMITVNHSGDKILVACEGEPSDDYLTDPEGTVAIIDISGGAENIDQSDVVILNFSSAPTVISGSLQKPGVSRAKDLEPEYITVSEDDEKAFVICQEANVLIVIDMVSESVASYHGLGFKDHSATGNKLDPSDKDTGINLGSWDVKGVYMPDAISSYTVDGDIYVVSANEGDARDYSGYSSEARIKDLSLDTTVFTDPTLQDDDKLGRLKTFTTDVIGDADNNGFVEELYCYGGRSFSIWDESGSLVYDSGDDFESYFSVNYTGFFNCDDGLAAEFDNRSDDKGPEPEAVVVGKIREQFFAFIGLERQGGILVYDVTDPLAPVFETYIQSFDTAAGTAVDVAPEGIVFIPADESHTGTNLLIISHEFSGTVAIYEIAHIYDEIGEQKMVSESIQIFPNPTVSEIRVQHNFIGAKKLNYEIRNSLGIVVLTGDLSEAGIDVSNLSGGIYYLTLVHENQNRKNISASFIKQ